jgi:hypothetical protein
VALLRLNLFTFHNIWDWLNKPFDTMPESIDGIQLKLKFQVLDSSEEKYIINITKKILFVIRDFKTLGT